MRISSDRASKPCSANPFYRKYIHYLRATRNPYVSSPICLATGHCSASIFTVSAIETIFGEIKQFAGLEAYQCWTDAAMVHHVALVLLTFVVLQRLHFIPCQF